MVAIDDNHVTSGPDRGTVRASLRARLEAGAGDLGLEPRELVRAP
jgi:hypothetical protein